VTPEETAGVLRYAATLDPWLGQTSIEEGAVMVTGWTDMLTAVDPQVAMDAVRAHYAEAGVRSIQPGDVLAAWRRHLTAQAAERETAERTAVQAVHAAQVVRGFGGSLGTYLRECLDTVAGGGRVEDVALPEGRPRLDEHTDRWQRRCTFHTICACSHTEYRAGFLDAETTITDAHGREHPAVRRCVVCADGILMAQERGIARRPRPGRR
jgi:hypothetical protein